VGSQTTRNRRQVIRGEEGEGSSVQRSFQWTGAGKEWGVSKR